MSVYVDDAIFPFGRMMMCHMVADTREELLEMADKIGVARKWIQDYGTPSEHFDVCKSHRKKAIANGAVYLERNSFVEMLRKKKEGIQK